MATYGDYTVLADVRARYLDVTATTDDVLLTDLIHSTSREIDAITNRHFYPLIDTLEYDMPARYQDWLYFDDDLLELTTLTNGDGTDFTTGQYKVYPLNKYPKQKVKILSSSSEQWQSDSLGDSEGVISAVGVWGYHADYTGAWVSAATVADATGINALATSVTVATGTIKAGWLLKIGAEYIYASAVATGATDTVTIVRGVNGSTAAIHATAAAISGWKIDERLEMLCRVAVAAYYRIRANPVGETVIIDDVSFNTPKDVTKYIDSRCRAVGVIRVGLG